MNVLLSPLPFTGGAGGGLPLTSIDPFVESASPPPTPSRKREGEI